MQVFAAVKCDRMKNLVSHVKCFEMLSLMAKSGKPFCKVSKTQVINGKPNCLRDSNMNVKRL